MRFDSFCLVKASPLLWLLLQLIVSSLQVNPNDQTNMSGLSSTSNVIDCNQSLKTKQNISFWQWHNSTVQITGLNIFLIFLIIAFLSYLIHDIINCCQPTGDRMGMAAGTATSPSKGMKNFLSNSILVQIAVFVLLSTVLYCLYLYACRRESQNMAARNTEVDDEKICKRKRSNSERNQAHHRKRPKRRRMRRWQPPSNSSESGLKLIRILTNITIPLSSFTPRAADKKKIATKKRVEKKKESVEKDEENPNVKRQSSIGNAEYLASRINSDNKYGRQSNHDMNETNRISPMNRSTIFTTSKQSKKKLELLHQQQPAVEQVKSTMATPSTAAVASSCKSKQNSVVNK